MFLLHEKEIKSHVNYVHLKKTQTISAIPLTKLIIIFFEKKNEISANYTYQLKEKRK